jgi:hypothetical protein
MKMISETRSRLRRSHVCFILLLAIRVRVGEVNLGAGMFKHSSADFSGGADKGEL